MAETKISDTWDGFCCDAGTEAFESAQQEEFGAALTLMPWFSMSIRSHRASVCGVAHSAALDETRAQIDNGEAPSPATLNANVKMSTRRTCFSLTHAVP